MKLRKKKLSTSDLFSYFPAEKRQPTLPGFIKSKTKYDLQSEMQQKFDDKVVDYIIKFA